MKVLLVMNGPVVGGAERVVVDLAMGLKQKGVDVSVAGLYPIDKVGEKLLTELKSCRIPYFYLEHTIGTYPLRPIIKYRSLLKQQRFDIVHAHCLLPIWLVCCFTPRTKKKPAILETPHNSSLLKRLKVFPANLLNVYNRISTTIHVAKHHDKSEPLPNAEEIVIQNGRNFSPLPPRAPARQSLIAEGLISQDDYVFVMIGRLVKAKNHASVIEAFSVFARSNNNSVLLIAGDGPERETLIAQVRRLGIHSRVKFLGIRADVRILLSDCDGCLMPSLHEQLSVAALEIVHSGIPVVFSPHPSFREIITKPLPGIIFSQGYSSEAILDSMKKVQNVRMVKEDHLKRQKVMESHFSVSAMVTKHLEAYRRALAKRTSD